MEPQIEQPKKGTITRIKTPTLIDVIKYSFGANIFDVWEFDINSDKYQFINQWRGSTQLYQNNNLIWEKTKLFHLTSKKPLVEIFVKDKKISIYMKAIVSNKIRIAINGKLLQNNFV